jgi:hypothetical protein
MDLRAQGEDIVRRRRIATEAFQQGCKKRCYSDEKRMIRNTLVDELFKIAEDQNQWFHMACKPI